MILMYLSGFCDCHSKTVRGDTRIGKNGKKYKMAIFAITVGSFGNLRLLSIPINGPCASFWMDIAKPYLDVKLVKVAIFVAVLRFLQIGLSQADVLQA